MHRTFKWKKENTWLSSYSPVAFCHLLSYQSGCFLLQVTNTILLKWKESLLLMWQSAGSSAPCCRTLALPAFLRSCSQGPSLWGCNGCMSLGLTSSHLQISEEKTSGHFSRSPSKVPTSSHWCCWICGQSMQCFDWLEVTERWALHQNLGLLAETGGINVKEANHSCWLYVWTSGHQF